MKHNRVMLTKLFESLRLTEKDKAWIKMKSVVIERGYRLLNPMIPIALLESSRRYSNLETARKMWELWETTVMLNAAREEKGDECLFLQTCKNRDQNEISAS